MYILIIRRGIVTTTATGSRRAHLGSSWCVLPQGSCIATTPSLTAISSTTTEITVLVVGLNPVATETMAAVVGVRQALGKEVVG